VSRLVEWLEEKSQEDTKVRAVLRRSLAFDPGSYAPAFPFVEPFLTGEESPWRRQVTYLVAGLWASHWREGRGGVPLSLGKACAAYQAASNSSSTERRFVSLLDADEDQLPHRLRQTIALLKDQNLDFADLLNRLFQWNHEQKRTQNAWARDFYRYRQEDAAVTSKSEKETSA